MSEEGIQKLADLTREQLHNYGQKWSQTDSIVLFRELREVLCRASCAWTGVPLLESEVGQRTKDLAAMIDGSAAIGLKYWRGKQSRKRAEKWIEEIIQQVRHNKLKVAENSGLYAIAMQQDLTGELLDEHTAAVEVINVLRPILAIARYVIFTVLALHEHPQYREKLQQNNEQYYEWFVQEVRRYYPFFPFASATVRQDFNWQGYHFP